MTWEWVAALAVIFVGFPLSIAAGGYAVAAMERAKKRTIFEKPEGSR